MTAIPVTAYGEARSDSLEGLLDAANQRNRKLLSEVFAIRQELLASQQERERLRGEVWRMEKGMLPERRDRDTLMAVAGALLATLFWCGWALA